MMFLRPKFDFSSPVRMIDKVIEDHQWPGPSYANFYFCTLGKYRKPKVGEYYLSGAIPAGYRAACDFSSEYWIIYPTHRAVPTPKKYERGPAL